MNEKLTRRIGRIIGSSLNTLLDALKNSGSGSIMEENIREIDAAIDEARSELGKFSADRHLSRKHLAKAEQKCAELVKKSELSVEQGHDTIAEEAVSELLDMEAETTGLARYISELGKKEKELERHIRDLKHRKQEIKEQLARHRENRSRPANGTKAGSESISRDMERREGRASAARKEMCENRSAPWNNGEEDKRGIEKDLAEVDRIYRNHRIQERLSAIKEKLKKGEP